MIQHINAVSGFAYGVIGADIHVFADGKPIYLLEEHRAAPPVDSRWLRELPSRMLNARNEVVPFTGRDAELERLRRWRDAGPRLAAKWLHGPGGQGKTRLAGRFAEETAASGWKVVIATHGQGTVLAAAQRSHDLRLDGCAGVLLVIDYADRWLLSHLLLLLDNALLHHVGRRTRILMLARTEDAWPVIGSVVNERSGALSSEPLSPIGPSLARRHEMFVAARDGFAKHYRVRHPAVIEAPNQLDGPDMELALSLHVAALVAVDAHATGRRPPRAMADLTVYLLDREHTHWATLYRDGEPVAGDGGRSYRTPAETMNRVVFAAALTGSVPADTGTAVLRHVDLPSDPMDALRDHRVCYPPIDPGSRALEPLYPDRLAEDFLALTLQGHDADYPSQSWASTMFAALVGPSSPTVGSISTLRGLTFAAEAAGRWPHVAERHLFPLLLRHPHVTIDAGSAALRAIAALRDLDMAVLDAIEPLLPDGRHVDLDLGAAAVVDRLTAHRLATTEDPLTRARLQSRRAFRLHNAGRDEDAATAATEAIGLLRPLADAAPDAHVAELADAVENLGVFLARLDRRHEALVLTEEAVALRRHSAASDPAKRGTLASALMNLGSRLAEAGRPKEALTRTKEAVALGRRLMAEQSDAKLPHFAGTLHNLAMDLARLGRHVEALPPLEEAVSIDRHQAANDPAAFLPNLAASLNLLSIGLRNVGQEQKALTPALEAVTILRTLSKANPAVYLPPLADALTNVGTLHSTLGDVDLALGVATESLSIARRQARTGTRIHLQKLAASLNNLSTAQARAGRREEAMVSVAAAVMINRQLVADEAAYLPGLAAALHNLGHCSARLGRYEDALRSTGEALSIRRRLAEVNPAAHRPDLASTLNTYAMQLRAMGQRGEAEAATAESLIIRRELAKADSVTYERALTSSLAEAVGQLMEAGRYDEALVPALEALDICRRRTTRNAPFNAYDLAVALYNAGMCLSRVERHGESITATEEAVTLFRHMAAAQPAAYRGNLASALDSLAADLAAVGDLEQAVRSASESISLRRELAIGDPAVNLPHLAQGLFTLAQILHKTGRETEAVRTLQESIATYRRLCERRPAAFLPRLGLSLLGLAMLHLEAGLDLSRAYAAVTEAISIYESPPVEHTSAVLDNARAAYETLADILEALGRESEAAALRHQLDS